MPHALQVLAGPRALARLREHGFRPDDVDAIVAASGGPKWLAISGLDRAVFAALAGHRNTPLHLIGSSIGSWQMACLAQTDAVAALERFETRYVEEQRYSTHPSPREVSDVAKKLLAAVLGDSGIEEILGNTERRLHVLTARSRGLSASEHRRVQLAGFAMAALGNVISRKSLRSQAQRVVFDINGDAGPFNALGDFPTRHVALTPDNLRDVLLASGSIPLVFEGVQIPGAPKGIYRDAGLIDYHPDIFCGNGQGFVLYPHFYSHVVPGWFDQWLPWRKPHARNFERTLLLAPTAEFVASLPNARIPDRKDFYRYSDDERVKAWRVTCAASRRLGDEFNELLESGRWMDRVKPLEL